MTHADKQPQNEKQWMPVLGFDGKYIVSNEGEIFSILSNKILKQSISNEYYGVTLYNNRKPKRMNVHRIVWESFNGKIPNGMHIDHISNNKIDNRLHNLELVTPRQNTVKHHKLNSNIMMGVYKNRTGKKWCARIHINGKSKHIGMYNTKEEAHQAYINELKKVENV